MYPGSRIAASALLGSVAAAGLITAAVFAPSPAPSLPQAFDDTSDYEGTECGINELYDVTDGKCASDSVSSDPLGWDDISNFGGTTCSADQQYDATVGRCVAAVVTNDPDAPVQPNSVGISDPGKQCAETQIYSVPDGKCMPDIVTNDPQAMVKPEGENPTAYTAPKAIDIPGCAAGNDPLSMCAGSTTTTTTTTTAPKT